MSEKIKKHYEVLLKAWAVVLVTDAEDEESAIEAAEEQVSKGDFEVEEWRLEKEVRNQELPSAKRRANRICKALE